MPTSEVPFSKYATLSGGGRPLIVSVSGNGKNMDYNFTNGGLPSVDSSSTYYTTVYFATAFNDVNSQKTIDFNNLFEISGNYKGDVTFTATLTVWSIYEYNNKEYYIKSSTADTKYTFVARYIGDDTYRVVCTGAVWQGTSNASQSLTKYGRSSIYKFYMWGTINSIYV